MIKTHKKVLMMQSAASMISDRVGADGVILGPPSPQDESARALFWVNAMASETEDACMAANLGMRTVSMIVRPSGPMHASTC